MSAPCLPTATRSATLVEWSRGKGGVVGCTLTFLPVAAADAAHPITTSTVSEWRSSERRDQAGLPGCGSATVGGSASQSLRAASAIFLLPLNHFLCESRIVCQLESQQCPHRTPFPCVYSTLHTQAKPIILLPWGATLPSLQQVGAACAACCTAWMCCNVCGLVCAVRHAMLPSYAAMPGTAFQARYTCLTWWYYR